MNPRRLPALVTFAATLLLAAPTWADGPQPPPAGTFSGEGLTVTLSRQGDDYSGAATLGQTRVNLTGRFSESTGLSGTFDASGSTFAWSARTEGDTLIFATGGVEYRLALPVTENPLARRPAPSAVPQPGSRPANQAGTIKFTRFTVKDPQMNNIDALSFLMPEGWQAQGGIEWFHELSVLTNLLMTVTDPQSGAQLQFLPFGSLTWMERPVFPLQEGSNYLGAIVGRPLFDPAEVIRIYYMPRVLSHLASARCLGVEDLPDETRVLARQYGDVGRSRAARVRYEFDSNGQPWQEDVYIRLWIGEPVSDFGIISWNVDSAQSLRAPKGMLDRLTPAMRTCITTLRLTQDWYSGRQYVQQLFNNRIRQGIKDSADLSRKIAQNNEEIRKMYADSWRQSQESQDRLHKEFGEVIRGVETYDNPYESRPVELPAGYNDVWVNPLGEYILSEQAGYDPNVGSTTEWRRMDASK